MAKTLTRSEASSSGFGVDAEAAKRLLSEMLLIRRFEEKAAEAYALGKIGGFLHLYIGEEAVAVGATSVLRPDDYAISAYREHGHLNANLDPRSQRTLDQIEHAPNELFQVYCARFQMLAACEFALAEPREIVFAGERPSAALDDLLRELRRCFVPNKVVLHAGAALTAWVPGISAMTAPQGSASVYVCRNYSCQLPVSEPARFAELIQ